MKSTKELARELGLLRKRSSSSVEQSLKRIKKTNQLFSYLVVIDFESTCWPGDKSRPQEIIEFPAVLMNTSTGEIEEVFHHYVQPQEHPTLSSFCKELTGISQDQVDQGIPISNCLNRFNNWLRRLSSNKQLVFTSMVEANIKACTFVTWSDWDLGVCLQYECRRKQLRKPPELNSWIDLRATYRKFYSRKPEGLNGALTDVGIEFSGRQHSGVDDARNTARLAWRMMCDGCVLQITKSLNGPGLAKAPLSRPLKSVSDSRNGSNLAAGSTKTSVTKTEEPASPAAPFIHQGDVPAHKSSSSVVTNASSTSIMSSSASIPIQINHTTVSTPLRMSSVASGEKQISCLESGGTGLRCPTVYSVPTHANISMKADAAAQLLRRVTGYAVSSSNSIQTAGLGISRVKTAFCRTNVRQNAVLTREIPTPETACMTASHPTSALMQSAPTAALTLVSSEPCVTRTTVSEGYKLASVCSGPTASTSIQEPVRPPCPASGSDVQEVVGLCVSTGNISSQSCSNSDNILGCTSVNNAQKNTPGADMLVHGNVSTYSTSVTSVCQPLSTVIHTPHCSTSKSSSPDGASGEILLTDSCSSPVKPLCTEKSISSDACVRYTTHTAVAAKSEAIVTQVSNKSVSVTVSTRQQNTVIPQLRENMGSIRDERVSSINNWVPFNTISSKQWKSTTAAASKGNVKLQSAQTAMWSDTKLNNSGDTPDTARISETVSGGSITKKWAGVVRVPITSTSSVKVSRSYQSSTVSDHSAVTTCVTSVTPPPQSSRSSPFQSSLSGAMQSPSDSPVTLCHGAPTTTTITTITSSSLSSPALSLSSSSSSHLSNKAMRPITSSIDQLKPRSSNVSVQSACTSSASSSIVYSGKKCPSAADKPLTYSTSVSSKNVVVSKCKSVAQSPLHKPFTVYEDKSTESPSTVAASPSLDRTPGMQRQIVGKENPSMVFKVPTPPSVRTSAKKVLSNVTNLQTPNCQPMSKQQNQFKTPVSGQRNASTGLRTPFGSCSYNVQSTMKRTPPMCECGRRSTRKVVQTPGPNQGRAFLCCPIGRRGTGSKQGCKFFKWDDDDRNTRAGVSPNFSDSSRSSNYNTPGSRTWHAFRSPMQQPNFNTPSTESKGPVKKTLGARHCTVLKSPF